MRTLKIINDNIRKVSDTNTLLDMLLEFEGVLDSFDIYAYRNWRNGEIIEGPKLGRYFIEVSVMYPYKDMPDPDAIKRLQTNQCEVKMYKDQLVRPGKVQSIEDTEIKMRGDQARRVAKPVHEDVWVVDIKMPRRFVDEFSTEQIEAAEDAYVDMEATTSAQDMGVAEQPALAGDTLDAATDPDAIV
jgi:hypothetical protein